MNKTIFKIIAITILAFSSCSVKNNLPIEAYESTNYPTDGVCTIEILKNKTMIVGTNEDSTMTYTLADDLKHSVVRFQYKRDMNQSEYDGSYREMTVFEIDNSILSQVIANEELPNTKMLAGIFCFCKGRAGLHKVNKGKLDLFINKLGKINFTLNFKMEKDPQSIKIISVIDDKLF